MQILALEPYHGGSHKAFLDGWSGHSRHEWTILGLPPYKWKWRMRHAAIWMAEQAVRHTTEGRRWNVLFCSDMLNLAEFRGLAPEAVRRLPSVAYFHENQLTYPVRHESERDYQFAFTNLTSALAAARVWFNSAFHRDSFLDALVGFLARMPDYIPTGAVERIRDKSSIHPQGIGELPPRNPRSPGPMRLLWAARWEHDKNPETFFEALTILAARGVNFRLSVTGQQVRETPPVFAQAEEQFGERIDRWGYQPTRRAYEAALAEADVIVSTANHEFFGISVVEAIAAGAYPMLPKRLAYPEILSEIEAQDTDDFFYDGSAKNLADKLTTLAARIDKGDLWQGKPDRGVRAVERFSWNRLAPVLDHAIERLT